MTNFFGSFLDAWDEVQVHRARVVLSLVGIVLAVFAMTSVTAAGMIFREIMQQSFERYTGRDTTISVNATGRESQPSADVIDGFYESVERRYGVKYASVTQQGFQIEVTSRNMAVPVSVTAVDPDFAVIHRMTPASGRWLRAGDATRMAPSVVVNQKMLEELGHTETQAPFAMELGTQPEQRVVVVGVMAQDEWMSTMWVLNDDLNLLVPDTSNSQKMLELWVPPERATQMAAEIQVLGEQQNLDVYATPQSDQGVGSVLTGLQILIFAISLFALFLGALGVLNVGVVTVRQRVREIGIRRALGASTGRIFAAVMLESVLATALAGLVGIALAVALVNAFPYSILPQELQVTEAVPFPVAAAVQAFIITTIIGALVGLVPATIAVRSKVIDAIRY